MIGPRILKLLFWIWNLSFPKKNLSKISIPKKRLLWVGVSVGRSTEAQASLKELERLAHTAGMVVVDRVLQIRKRPDGRFDWKGEIGRSDCSSDATQTVKH